MGSLGIFIIRLILGVAFAVILMRLFYPGFNPMYAVGLGIILISLAYLLEFLKMRNQKRD